MNAPVARRHVDSFDVVLMVFYLMDPFTLDVSSWGFSSISWLRLVAWIHGGWHF